MRNLIFFLGSSILLLSCQIVLAQDKNQELTIGDTIPNINLEYRLLNPKNDLTVSDLYGDGLLLLNFWATWCGPCLDEMQKLSGYVEAYPQLNVLSVTYQNNDDIEQFLSNRPDIRVDRTYVLADDTLFNQMFPHQALPHNVWVDREGIVRAIGSFESVNTERIEQMIAGDFSQVAFKKDIPFDYLSYLALDDSIINFRSIFQPKLADVNINGFVIATYGKKKRFLGWNLNITQLLWAAHYRQQKAHPNHRLIEFNVADSTKYFWPEQDTVLFKKSAYKSRDNWADKNLFTYELIATNGMNRDEFYERMVYDLNTNFGVKSGLALRNRRCRVVTAMTNDVLETHKSSNGSFMIRVDHQNDELVVSRATIPQLLSYITESTFNQGDNKSWRYEPFVDETNFKGTISCRIPLHGSADLKNIHFWEALLSDYFGFKFDFAVRAYPVLIIDDL